MKTENLVVPTGVAVERKNQGETLESTAIVGNVRAALPVRARPPGLAPVLLSFGEARDPTASTLREYSVLSMP